MTHYTKVVAGLVGYIKADILSKLSGGISKWAYGALVAYVADRSDKLLRIAQNVPILNFFLTEIGAMQGEELDADNMYRYLLEEARQGSATIKLLGLPPLTLTQSDVESLYRHIQQGG